MLNGVFKSQDSVQEKLKEYASLCPPPYRLSSGKVLLRNNMLVLFVWMILLVINENVCLITENVDLVCF